MPVITCKDIDCENISKRRTKFLDGNGHEVMCHTCKANLVNIRSIATGDESITDYLGYQPYECTKGKQKCAIK